MSDEALVAAIKRGQEADALRARVAALEAEVVKVRGTGQAYLAQAADLRAQLAAAQAECRRLDGECKAMFEEGLKHGRADLAEAARREAAMSGKAQDRWDAVRSAEGWSVWERHAGRAPRWVADVAEEADAKAIAVAQAALREAQVREVVLVEALGGLVRDVFKDCACDGNGARCDFHASLTAARAALASPSDAAAQLLAELTTAREQLTVAANFGDAVARATIGKLQADEPADARAHAVRKLYEALAEMVESSPLAIKGGRLEAAIKNGLDRLRGL